MREKIELFKVMSEPNRVRILMMLLAKPMCVCEVAWVLGLTAATVSNHLSYLRKEGFIEDEKDGKWINYKIATKKNNPIINILMKNLVAWFGSDEEIIEDREKLQKANRYEICCTEGK